MDFLISVLVIGQFICGIALGIYVLVEFTMWITKNVWPKTESIYMAVDHGQV